MSNGRLAGIQRALAYVIFGLVMLAATALIVLFLAGVAYVSFLLAEAVLGEAI